MPPPTNKQKWHNSANRYSINLCASFDGGINNNIDDGFKVPNWWTYMHVGGTYSAIGEAYSTRRFWTEAKYTRPSGTGSNTDWAYPQVSSATGIPFNFNLKLAQAVKVFPHLNDGSVVPMPIPYYQLPVLRKLRQSQGLTDQSVQSSNGYVFKPIEIGKHEPLPYAYAMKKILASTMLKVRLPLLQT